MKEKKISSSRPGFKLIFLAASLHLIGIVSSLLRIKKETSFHLPFHLLRFFAWWSVHASLLTVLAAILIWRESKHNSHLLRKKRYGSLLLKEKKENSSHFSQLIIFLATIYNLVTFCFLMAYFLMGALKSYGLWMDLQLFSWHFAAPFLTIYYFYAFSQIEILKKKLIKSLLLSFIYPLLYFFYVWILAKINTGETSSLFPYMEKYPYSIFEWIAEREWKIFTINFLIALLAYLFICFMIIWTKSLIKNRKAKKNSHFF